MSIILSVKDRYGKRKDRGVISLIFIGNFSNDIYEGAKTCIADTVIQFHFGQLCNNHSGVTSVIKINKCTIVLRYR